MEYKSVLAGNKLFSMLIQKNTQQPYEEVFMMQKNFYRTTRSSEDHTRFGGRIFIGDFDRKTSLADMAGRIISDLCFDRECRQNAGNRDFNSNTEKRQ